MLRIILTTFLLTFSTLFAASLSERLTNNLKNISELKSIGYSLQSGEVYVVKRDGKYYKKFDTKPFSGRAVYINKDTLVRLFVSDGVKDGYLFVFTYTGNLLKEENYKEGKLDGRRVLWSKDSENKILDIIYKDNLPCEGWVKMVTKELKYEDCKKSGYELRKTGDKIYKIIYEKSAIKEKSEIDKKR